MSKKNLRLRKVCMHDKELDNLLSDDFLDSLEDKDKSIDAVQPSVPEWVTDNEEDVSYRAWKAILELKSEKTQSINTYKKVVTNKTAVSVYQIKKSEVGKVVDKAPQNLFRGKAAFCSKLLDFFDEQNDLLLEFLKQEQEKLTNLQKVTGIRTMKKEQIVGEYQKLRDKVEFLRRKHVKESIDLVISRMPLDLQSKLRSK